MTILGLAESFKIMDRPDLTVMVFDSLFFGKYNSNPGTGGEL